jgi:hypothetical protein
MRSYTREDVERQVAAAEAIGHIYNVEYGPLRTRFNGVLEDAYRAVWTVHLDTVRANGWGNTNYPNDSYYTNPMAHTVAGAVKSVQKDRRALKRDYAWDAESGSYKEMLDSYDRAETFLVEWIPLAARVLALKEKIVMGKKPSTTPRTTPERTLTNTGTCGLCGHNVKREGNGGLYHHGFELKYNSREGRCFGTGYQPIELSSAVLVDFLAKGIKPRVENLTTLLARIEKNEVESVPHPQRRMARNLKEADEKYPRLTTADAGFERARKLWENEISSELDSWKRDEVRFGELIEAWEAKPLPDANLPR